MSLGGLSTIMSRIASATPCSKIAVFKTPRAGLLDAVFADTTYSKMLINSRHPDYIGSYDATMDRYAVSTQLESFIK